MSYFLYAMGPILDCGKVKCVFYAAREILFIYFLLGWGGGGERWLRRKYLEVKMSPICCLARPSIYIKFICSTQIIADVHNGECLDCHLVSSLSVFAGSRP